MQQREFPSLLFFPNGEREFPFPSVFSLCREGIPLLFLFMMTLLFSPQEQWEVIFFPCFPFSHKRVADSPFFPSSPSQRWRGIPLPAIFCRHSLYQFSALIFQYGNYFFFFTSLSTAFYPTKIWNQTPTSNLVTGSCDLNIAVST